MGVTLRLPSFFRQAEEKKVHDTGTVAYLTPDPEINASTLIRQEYLIQHLERYAPERIYPNDDRNMGPAIIFDQRTEQMLVELNSHWSKENGL